METNKKLELLTGIVDEFNLSVNDVVSYWVKSGRLNLDAATVSSQVVSSGKYETPKRVLPGMYIYADGLIYPEIIEGRQVMAIVGSVDGSDVLAVCLQEACLPWSSDWLEAKATQKMTGGKEATRKILEISRKKRQGETRGSVFAVVNRVGKAVCQQSRNKCVFKRVGRCFA